MTKEDIALGILKEIIYETEYENHVYLVGGAVRDSIMGLPIKDIDLCIDIPNGGINFANWITEILHTNVVTFPTYGTAMFQLCVNKKTGEKVQIECVQTRKEQYHDINSRNPETCFGTLNEDCYRRDLTINSLYRSISTGEIIDITGKGINDIKNNIIRTPCDPNITFSDDPLRMLRILRFSSRYGWNIEKETLDGIIDNVKRIQIITQERITDELNKILVCKNPCIGLEFIRTTGLLEYVLPEFVETVTMGQNKFHFGTVWEHTLAVVNQVEPKLENRLAALFHDIGKIKTKSIDENGNVHFYQHELKSADLTEVILTRMKYPTDTIKLAKKAIINHMRTKSFGDGCNVKDKSLRKLQYVLGNDIDLCLDVIDADNKSHAIEYCMPNQVSLIKSTLEKMRNDGLDCTFIKLPINGNDIMQILNIEPSSVVKEIIKKLTDLYISNPKKMQDKDQCIKEMVIIHKNLLKNDKK